MKLNTQLENRPTSLLISNTGNVKNEIDINVLDDRLSIFVDSDYYRDTYDDICNIDINPMNHYVKIGWREQRRPNRWYTDTLVPKDIIDKNPTIPPFLLFLIYLPNMNIVKFEKLIASNGYIDVGHENCWTCNLMRDEFDGNYYRSKYPEINISTDALANFCEIGWIEQRNPNEKFNTKYYLLCNEDVRNAGINPFVHYLNTGINEGRKPQPKSIINHQLLRNLKTISELSQDYRGITPKLKLVSQSDLMINLMEQCIESKGLCVTLSHDDYMTHTGGVQKFIRDESNCAQEDNYVYLHLCPAIPDICINQTGSAISSLVNCTINDFFVGTFTVKEISEIFSSMLNKQPYLLQVAVIHSVMGWNISSVISVVMSAFKHKFFYVHDYFAICTEYRLLRNNIIPCDAPKMKSIACNICAHGDTREKQVKDFLYLFNKINPTLIYPSNCAKNIFMKGFNNFKQAGIIVPHIKVINYLNDKKYNKRDREKIRIAYCGSPIGHKGFYHFEQIVEKLHGAGNLKFFHFGNEDTKLSGVKFVKTVLKNGQSLMSDKVSENEIDIVFIGSTWRETFNFVTYEAVQAGAAILALSSAGNVCDFLNEYNVGAVVNNLDEAVELLLDNDLVNKLDSWQEMASNLSFIPNKSFLTEGVM